MIARALSLALIASLAAGAAAAQDVDRAVKARKSLMTLNSHYLGPLGAMAKGELAYDAEKAGKAAAALAELATFDQSAMWPQGSDQEALGATATRALPKIWATFPAIMEKSAALKSATANLASAAGGGLDSLKAALGPVGAACGGCHEEFRAPN